MAVRDTQTSVEVLVEPDAPKGRATQTSVEAVVYPDDTTVSVSQVSVEVLIQQSFVYPHSYAQVIG